VRPDVEIWSRLVSGRNEDPSALTELGSRMTCSRLLRHATRFLYENRRTLAERSCHFTTDFIKPSREAITTRPLSLYQQALDEIRKAKSAESSSVVLDF